MEVYDNNNNWDDLNWFDEHMNNTLNEYDLYYPGMMEELEAVYEWDDTWKYIDDLPELPLDK